METTIVYRGYMGIMENKMATTIVYGVIYGYWKIKWKLVLLNPKPKPFGAPKPKP